MRSNLASTVATVTAVVAIVLGIWDGVRDRQHDRLSVRPHLVLDYSVHRIASGSSELTIAVSNEGLGPAIIDSMTIGKAVAGGANIRGIDWITDKGGSISWTWEFRTGDAIGSQKSIKILVAAFSPRDVMGMRGVADSLHSVIAYRSLYGEAFVAALRSK